MGHMEFIRYYYGAPVKRGKRIAYTWNGRREGTIVSARDGKFNVRFDDTGKIEGPFHPTWEIEYLWQS